MVEINSNPLSVSIVNKFNTNTQKLSDTVGKLVTGNKFNQSSDGPGVFSRLKSLEGFVRSSGQALENFNVSSNFVAQETSRFQAIGQNVSRIGELVNEAASSGSLPQRQSLQNEINSLRNEIDQLGENNSSNLPSTPNIQTGQSQAFVNDRALKVQVGVEDSAFVNLPQAETNSALLNLDSINVESKPSQAELDAFNQQIDDASAVVSNITARFQSTQEALQQRAESLFVNQQNIEQTQTDIQTVDFSEGADEFTSGQITSAVGGAALTEANTEPAAVLAALDNPDQPEEDNTAVIAPADDSIVSSDNNTILKPDDDLQTLFNEENSSVLNEENKSASILKDEGNEDEGPSIIKDTGDDKAGNGILNNPSEPGETSFDNLDLLNDREDTSIIFREQLLT